jgi:phenylalanyl-tRNA synthetase beta chain
MKFTLTWLKDHLDTSASAEEISLALVELGLEVESVQNPLEGLKDFIIADVVSREKHPEADRLNLCQVSDGSGEILTIVCGASNVREGMKVVLAREGVVIPATGQALKKGKIRGIESEGMLCSAAELNLGFEAEGIMDLETSLPAGSKAASYFTDLDVVFDISITPNRSDCFSVRGIARDLAAKGLGKFKALNKVEFQEAGSSPLTIKIDTTHCYQFNARLIEGVDNTGKTPDFIAKRLESVGQKLISPIVDITNYICLDLGQPLHAFDADYMGKAINVRMAKEGESLQALNNTELLLSDTMLVVANDAAPQALGGIIGGLNSGCQIDTKNIILEVAHFDPQTIALAGQKLNVYTLSLIHI